MRRIVLAGLAMSAMLALASSSLALERRAVRNIVDTDSWSRGGSCQVAYFNLCTGWLWVWSGFPANERVGVTNNSGCWPFVLTQTLTYQLTATPPGYGFTGTIAVHNADAQRCPVGAPLASQPWLSSGNDVDISLLAHNWNAYVPNTFALVYTFGPASGNPTEMITEHPLAGPTGPAACGTCYPTSRVNHTFDWGSVSAPACPGSTFADGSGCDAQICVVEYFPGIGIAVEPRTWSNLKSLYR